VHAVAHFCKTYASGIQIALVLVALFFLSYQITRPLVDYDEATYAKIAVDTLRSGDIFALQIGGTPWFEKPPLYLWMAMGAVKIFGAEEFAFRVPVVLLSSLCLWLLYRIVKEFTDDDLAASLAFLVLLFSEPFLIFAREARTDQGALLGIIAALFFYIRGWKDNTYLLWVCPAIAVGFLFKSVIVFLVVPAILIYSLLYRQWSWIRSKYLWWGSALSLAIIIPWHLVETIRFGSSFWNSYFFAQVFQRSVSTVTGTNNYYDYVVFLVRFYKPWVLVILLLTSLILVCSLSKRFRENAPLRHFAAPLLTALLIVILFTAARTHLPTYILPAFAFLAMYIAIAFWYFLTLIQKEVVRFGVFGASLLFVGFYTIFSAASALDQVPLPTFDEQAIGKTYRQNPEGPMYAIGWPILETLNFYGDTQTMYIDVKTAAGKNLNAPFYLIIPSSVAGLFFFDAHTPKYAGLKIIYMGTSLLLLHGDQNLQLPVL
jgi:4-amino-4-deoxy-L-arabinose transferase-like glycosyltransferase